MPTPETYLAQHAQLIRAFQAQPQGRSWALANNASFVGEYSELLVASSLTVNRLSGRDPWDEAVNYRTREFTSGVGWHATRQNCGYAGISYASVDLWLPLSAVSRGDWGAATGSTISRPLKRLVAGSTKAPNRVLTVQVKSRLIVWERDHYDAIGYKYFVDESASAWSRNDLLANRGAFPWRTPSVDLFACVEWDAMTPGVVTPSIRVLTRKEVVDAIYVREARASAKHGAVGTCLCNDCATPMSWGSRKIDFLEVFNGPGLGTDVTSTARTIARLVLP